MAHKYTPLRKINQNYKFKDPVQKKRVHLFTQRTGHNEPLYILKLL